MSWLNRIIDYYTYRITWFFSRKGVDKEWNLERAKNLLFLYAFFFFNTLLLLFFEIFNFTDNVRQYFNQNLQYFEFIKLILVLLQYFIFRFYLNNKINNYNMLRQKFLIVKYQKFYDLLIIITLPLLLAIFFVLIKSSFNH